MVNSLDKEDKGTDEDSVYGSQSVQEKDLRSDLEFFKKLTHDLMKEKQEVIACKDKEISNLKIKIDDLNNELFSLKLRLEKPPIIESSTPPSLSKRDVEKSIKSKILMVDDDLDLVDSTRMILSLEGYEMLVAESGTECLEILKNEKPDLILLDIEMPKMDGWEVCKKIKTDEKTWDIPVVIYTGNSTEEDKKKSLEYADAHINKPSRTEHILEVVNSFLKD